MAESGKEHEVPLRTSASSAISASSAASRSSIASATETSLKHSSGRWTDNSKAANVLWKVKQELSERVTKMPDSKFPRPLEPKTLEKVVKALQEREYLRAGEQSEGIVWWAQVEEKVEVGEGEQAESVPTPRWTPLGTRSTKMSSEKELGLQYQDLLQAIGQAVREQDKDQEECFFSYQGNLTRGDPDHHHDTLTPFAPALSATKVQPDIACSPAHREDSKVVPWEYIKGIVEFERKRWFDSTTETDKDFEAQMASYALKIVQAQPGVEVFHGLSIGKDTFLLWKFGPRRIHLSKRYNISSDWETFIQAVAFLSSSSARSSFPFAEGSEFSIFEFEATTPETDTTAISGSPYASPSRRYMWVSQLQLIARPRRIFGRRTVVVSGKLRQVAPNPSDEPIDVVLKVSFLEHALKGREASLTRLLTSGELESHAFGAMAVLDSGAFSIEEDYVAEVLITVGKPGTPFYANVPILALLRGARDCVRCIWSAWKVGRLHHRDISTGNIVLVRPKEVRSVDVEKMLDSAVLEISDPEAKSNLYGQLIDFGNSRIHKADLVSVQRDGKSGTITFMSRNMQRACRKIISSEAERRPDFKELFLDNLPRHVPVDDLESLFWVLMYQLSAVLNPEHAESMVSKWGCPKNHGKFSMLEEARIFPIYAKTALYNTANTVLVKPLVEMFKSLHQALDLPDSFKGDDVKCGADVDELTGCWGRVFQAFMDAFEVVVGAVKALELGDPVLVTSMVGVLKV